MSEGFTTHAALQILSGELQEIYKKYYSKKNIIYYLFISFKSGILKKFLLTNVLLIFLFIFELFFKIYSNQTISFWRVILCCNFFFISALNFALLSLGSQSRYSSIFHKFQMVIDDIKNIMDSHCKGWLNVGNYPFVKIPFASSVNLQWTFRDNQLINLPVALLVKGDMINLRPGQYIFADCEINSKSNNESNYQKVFTTGETFLSKIQNEKVESRQFCDRRAHRVIPMKGCVKAVVTKTPIIGLIDDYFDNHCNKNTWLITVPERYIEFGVNILLIILLIGFILDTNLHIIWFVLIGQTYNLKWSASLCDILLIGFPFQLPLLLFVIMSNIIWKVNFLRYKLDRKATMISTTASIESIPSSLSLSSSNIDQFESDSVTMETVGTLKYLKGHWNQVKNQDSQFVKMIYSMGSLTSLCCVDKKGILADPIATPEKLFMYRKRHKHRSSSLINLDRIIRKSNPDSSNQINIDNSVHLKLRSLVKNGTVTSLDLNSNQKNFHNIEPKTSIGSNFKNEHLIPNLDMNCSLAVPVILDMTRCNTHPYLPAFDDSRWDRYISSLKPIGLNILLNNCNPDVTDRYINFTDNMSAINFKNLNKSQLMQRCICSLAAQIGFKPTATDRFMLESTFAVCKKNDKSFDSSFNTSHAYSLPVGNVFSTVVKDSVQENYQIMSQGSADLLLSMCSDYWDGKDISPLTSYDRSRALDFYNRNIFSSYCIAFAYSPLFNKITFDGFEDQFILEMFDNTDKKFNMSTKSTYTNKMSSNSLSYSNVFSKGKSMKWLRCSTSELTDETLFKSEEIESLLKHQIFLGMISLQGDQVQSDVIECINRLEQACIRFVFFSTDNQLRSRVFAERLGMESGWNCHISLAEPYESSSKYFSNTRRNSSKSSKPFQEDSFKETLGSKRSCNSEPILHVTNYETDQITHSTTLNEKNLVLPKCEKEESISTKQLLWNDLQKSDVTISSSEDSSVSTKRQNSYLENPQDHFPEDKSKLPCGIKSIRPHLEEVDNVPLQVSLFTDCNPEVDYEMMNIMREYGEIICCCGSALTIKNVSLFSSNDCAVAFVPTLHKQCWRQHETKPDAVLLTKGYQFNKSNKITVEEEPMVKKKLAIIDQAIGFPELTPINIACRLVALPCGLLLNRKTGFNLIHFITECHRLVKNALSSVAFYCLSCIHFLILKLLFDVVLFIFGIYEHTKNLCLDLNFFPRDYHIVYHFYFHAPILALVIYARLALIGKPLKEPPRKRGRLLTYKQCYRFIVASMGRFLPSVVICLFVLAWSILIINRESSVSNSLINGTVNMTSEQISLIPVVIGDFLFMQHNIYIIIISMIYINPEKPFWKFNYFKNFRWLIVALILSGMQFMYFVISWHSQSDSSLYLDIWRKLYFPLISATGGILIVLLIGLIATYWEIKALSVEHRLARLYFGTKLGMYSPV